MMCTPTQDVWQPAGCVSCELVCVCVSLVRVVIICLASTHTALVSSPSLTVLHLTTYIHCASAVSGALTSEKPFGSLLIANPVSRVSYGNVRKSYISQ